MPCDTKDFSLALEMTSSLALEKTTLVLEMTTLPLEMTTLPLEMPDRLALGLDWYTPERVLEQIACSMVGFVDRPGVGVEKIREIR